MNVTTSLDCPRCAAGNAAIDLVSSLATGPMRHAVFGRCRVCTNGIMLDVGGEPRSPVPDDSSSALDQLNAQQMWREGRYAILAAYPEKPTKKIEALPERVESAFTEAEDVFRMEKFSSAATMYRRAIERTLKVEYPDMAGDLNKRIRTLATNGLLPDILINLLDRVRFLGNDAAHDLQDVSKDDATAGREFTALFLRLTYELPAQVERAIDAREARTSKN